MVDISIVLCVHRARRYLRRTMLSLEEAVDYARQCGGLSIELVIVQDRCEDDVRDWFSAYDAKGFDSVQTLEVDNGSLGASRNDGVQAALGAYVVTYDDDDLVSYNFILGLYDAAREAGDRALVFPEYVFVFGSNEHMCRYAGGRALSPLFFLSHHPLLSRVCARREIFLEIPYADIRQGSGYAFEDWHFNSEAVSRGVEIAIAPGTILFYRQRAGGLLQSANAAKLRHIPPSRLFEPEVYRQLCATDYQRYKTAPATFDRAHDVRAAFLDSPVCMAASQAANLIDRGCFVGIVPQIPAFTNVEGSVALGAAYFELCEPFVGRRFDRVLLSSDPTSALLAEARTRFARRSSDEDTNLLVVALGPGVDREGYRVLAAKETMLDLFNLHYGFSDQQRDLLLVKLLQSTCSRASFVCDGGRDVDRFLDANGLVIRNIAGSFDILSGVDGETFGSPQAIGV